MGESRISRQSIIDAVETGWLSSAQAEELFQLLETMPDDDIGTAILRICGEEVARELLRGSEDLQNMVSGRFRVEEMLGEGGMGQVYRAFDTEMNREVAIKLLRQGPLASERLLERFQREGKAVAKLSHSGIVRIFDLYQDGDSLVMVMELLEGESLGTIFSRRALGVRESVDIMISVLEAMDVAHANGVVHRDLKFDNIMILPDGKPKVIDFGLARNIVDPTTTAYNAILGTPHYMAPEQIKASRNVDFRADIYSLGVILFRMLTGNYPFDGVSAVDLYTKVLNEDPSVPSDLAEFPEELDIPILKALEKEPRHRHRSASDFRDALVALVESGIIDEQPRQRRTSNRSRRVRPGRTPTKTQSSTFAMGMVVGILLILGLGWYVAQGPEPEEDEGNRVSNRRRNRRRVPQEPPRSENSKNPPAIVPAVNETTSSTSTNQDIVPDNSDSEDSSPVAVNKTSVRDQVIGLGVDGHVDRAIDVLKKEAEEKPHEAFPVLSLLRIHLCRANDTEVDEWYGRANALREVRIPKGLDQAVVLLRAARNVMAGPGGNHDDLHVPEETAGYPVEALYLFARGHYLKGENQPGIDLMTYIHSVRPSQITQAVVANNLVWKHKYPEATELAFGSFDPFPAKRPNSGSPPTFEEILRFDTLKGVLKSPAYGDAIHAAQLKFEQDFQPPIGLSHVRSALHWKQGDYAKARAEVGDQQDPRSRSLRAATNYMLGDLKGAREELKGIDESNIRMGPVNHLRALLEPNKRVAHLKEGLRYNPEDPHLLAALAMATMKKPDQALKLAQQVGRRVRGYPYARAALGTLLVHQGKTAEGLKELKPIADRVPEARYNQMVGYVNLGNYKEAKASFDALLKRFPGFLKKKEERALQRFFDLKNWTVEIEEGTKHFFPKIPLLGGGDADKEVTATLRNIQANATDGPLVLNYLYRVNGLGDEAVLVRLGFKSQGGKYAAVTLKAGTGKPSDKPRLLASRTRSHKISKKVIAQYSGEWFQVYHVATRAGVKDRGERNLAKFILVPKKNRGLSIRVWDVPPRDPVFRLPFNPR